MSKNTMGRRIVERREALGISQAELARRVGISPQAMQWIEAGKTLRPRFLTEIAQNLGVASEWLLFGNIVQAAPPKPAEPAALGYEIGLLERGWIEELEGAFPAPPRHPQGARRYRSTLPRPILEASSGLPLLRRSCEWRYGNFCRRALKEIRA